MNLLNHLRFYWPLLMVAFYFLMYDKRIKAKIDLLLVATLMLFGLSRLMSVDLLPRLISILPLGQENMMSTITQLHWIFQVIAAIVGWLVLKRMASYFQLKQNRGDQ